MPPSPRNFMVLLVILLFLFVFIQMQAITLVFDKLGISAESAMLLFGSSLFGGLINLPLFSIQADKSEQAEPPQFLPLAGRQQIPFTGRTVIAVNVGGALIPVSFSVYLMLMHNLPLLILLAALLMTTTVSYLFSRPIKGIGIGMPILIAPVTSALVALMLLPDQAAALAYISGTLGVLIGADLLRLKHIRHMGVPIASIGGAGTFDGIFITGIIAVLLT